MKLLGLSGSIRSASTSTAVLKTVAERLPAGVNMTIFPLNPIPIYNADEDGEKMPGSVHDLKEAIASSDAVILCSPEYNYGMSGVLKNALDWASRPAYHSPLRNKPALIMTSSPGLLGGVRAHQQVRDTLVACLARVIAVAPVAIGGVYQKVTDGKLVDEESIGFVLAAVEELLNEIALLRRGSQGA